MKYYKDGNFYTEREIRRAHPNVSFGKPFSPAGFGYLPVVETAKPEVTELQIAVLAGADIADGTAHEVWTVQDRFTDTETETKEEQETAYLQMIADSEAEVRRREIYARLAEIDAESVRPLRATLAGTASQTDTDKLAELDTEAAILRTELAGLGV